MAIDWTRGYSASWRAYAVNIDTWADGNQLIGVMGADIERTIDGDASLLESGVLTLDVKDGAPFDGGYVRLAMLAIQGGEAERIDVATMLYVPSGDGTGVVDVEGRSVLLPAAGTRLTIGTYAPSGADAAQYVAKMLREVIHAPVVVTGTAKLGDVVVFDVGSTVLEAAWLVLDACNLTMRISGDGTVSIGPEPTEPALLLDVTGTRLLHDDVNLEPIDWTGVPNRYIAIADGKPVTAANDDPASVTSHATRGYWVDVVDTSPVRIGGETMQTYCERRLAEESVAYVVRTYDREWWPGVRPGDLVQASERTLGVDGNLRVRRQSLTCDKGVVVSEEARMEVSSWPTG